MLAPRSTHMAVGDILVGRAAELHAVDGALTDLRRAAARPLVVEGEPGIGKTRLLGELASRAAAGGCTVLSGSATELEHDLPFWLFVDALDESVARPDSRVLAPADDDLRAELAQVLPSMAGQVSDERPVVQDERYRTHRAVRELLERLAARRPLVLILDDVHWADPSSAELLIGLLRAPPDAAVLLALAMRPHNVPGRLAGAIARAERQGSLQRLRLRGLAPSEATALLGDGIDAAQAQALYAQTGGNPFYLEQLRRFGQASGGSRVEDDETPLTDGVPRAVVLSIDEELAHLGE